ncbi:MAG: ABC transporter ATP-binding protein [Caldisphaeraceae archaeon]|nr:ABC transporter ATP-binding protein [Caldisphaeraceae archaeon]MEB2793849.1 ABC transporter ATP-binding protein [Caldisphaeraceae archaeon]MEB3692541.1 ABC transporter ATP-binding protein [Caldisphaeraceae archaeon]MEB3798355.1 ABC transporter ATP-binding protein [Caldisphaeraceae archaeon]
MKKIIKGGEVGRVLEAVNIGFTYGKRKIFEKISMSVGNGRIVAVVGPSGVGKSTLLRVLGGFLRPDEGKVLLMGKEVTRPTPKIMLIHQSIVTFPWMTALENVMLGLKYRKLPKELCKAIARQMLEMVGLEGFEDFYPKELSGGMRQRIAIARALAADPLVLLMDEPFAHLDELTAEALRRELYKILFNVNSTLKGVILVSHNLSEVVELSDVVYVLNGRPATIVAKVEIEMERPRNPRDQKFYYYIDVLNDTLLYKGEV